MRRDLALSVLVLLLVAICLAQSGGAGYGGINPQVIMMDVMDGAINGAVQGAIRGAEQSIQRYQRG